MMVTVRRRGGGGDDDGGHVWRALLFCVVFGDSDIMVSSVHLPACLHPAVVSKGSRIIINGHICHHFVVVLCLF